MDSLLLSALGILVYQDHLSIADASTCLFVSKEWGILVRESFLSARQLCLTGGKLDLLEQNRVEVCFIHPPMSTCFEVNLFPSLLPIYPISILMCHGLIPKGKLPELSRHPSALLSVPIQDRDAEMRNERKVRMQTAIVVYFVLHEAKWQQLVPGRNALNDTLSKYYDLEQLPPDAANISRGKQIQLHRDLVSLLYDSTLRSTVKRLSVKYQIQWPELFAPYTFHCLVTGVLTEEVLDQFFTLSRVETLKVCEQIKCFDNVSLAGLQVKDLAKLNHPEVVCWLFDPNNNYMNANLVKDNRVPFEGLCSMRAVSQRHITMVLRIVKKFVLSPESQHDLQLPKSPVMVCKLLAASRPSLLEVLLSPKCLAAIRDNILEVDDIIQGDSMVTATRVTFLLKNSSLYSACAKGVKESLFRFRDVMELRSRRHVELMLSSNGMRALREGLVSVESFRDPNRVRYLGKVLRHRGYLLLCEEKARNPQALPNIQAVCKKLETQIHDHDVPLSGNPKLNTLCELRQESGSGTSSFAVIHSGALRSQQRNKRKVSSPTDVLAETKSKVQVYTGAVHDTLVGEVSGRLPDLQRESENHDSYVAPLPGDSQSQDVDSIEGSRTPSTAKLAILEKFMNFMGIEDEENALDTLCACDWNIEQAIDLSLAMNTR